MISTGRAVAFTVNFGPDVLRRAEKAKGGVFDHLRRRITLELTKALGDSPSLFCALDKTGTGRLHIHGLVACTRLQAEAVAAALRRAGGTWASGRGIEHQVRLQADHWELNGEDFFDLDRPLTSDWGSYCVKHAKALRAQTKHSVIYASADVKAAAHAHHKQELSLKICD